MPRWHTHTDNNPTPSRESPGVGQRVRGHIRTFARGERAQTSIDLVFGVMLFFAAISIVFVNAPTLFAPADYGNADHDLTADRIALDIEQTHFSQYGTAGAVHTNVESFFDTTDPTALNDEFNVDSSLEVNISVYTTNGEQLQALNAVSGEAGDERTLGPALDPINDNPSVSRRKTTLDSTEIVIKVSVWR